MDGREPVGLSIVLLQNAQAPWWVACCAFQFTLDDDPGLVWVDGFTLGDFPGSTGRTFTPVGPVISPTVGTVTFGAYSLGASPEGPSGDGLLALLTLRALAEGQSDLGFIAAQVSDRAGNSQTLSITPGGRVSVASWPYTIYLPAVRSNFP